MEKEKYSGEECSDEVATMICPQSTLRDRIDNIERKTGQIEVMLFGEGPKRDSDIDEQSSLSLILARLALLDDRFSEILDELGKI